MALDEKYCGFSLLGKESTVDSPPPSSLGAGMDYREIRKQLRLQMDGVN